MTAAPSPTAAAHLADGPMRPLYAAGMFAWLHEPVGARAPRGVVLCPAFAQEEMCTHVGWLELADMLASLGMPALRIDYRGTGHSIDAELSLEGMIEDARAAAHLLVRDAGVSEVVFVGLRLGAAVALEASRDLPFAAGAAMLSPVLSGASFLRETRAAASVVGLARFDPVPPQGAEGVLNTNGFRWSVPFQRSIQRIDLLASPAPDVPLLVLTATSQARAERAVEGWRASRMEVCEFPEYPGWMQDPMTSTVPGAAFARLAEWAAALPARAAPAFTPIAPAVSDRLDGMGFCETPCRFGPRDANFGILCQPAADLPRAPLGVLMLHEGSSHAVGDGGAYVAMARQLARMGFASLRMDITGMGDSRDPANTRIPFYDPARLPECLAGLDLLEDAGWDHMVVIGLCAGAHTALHTALADDRVVGNILINLQKFIRYAHEDIRLAMRENRRTLKAYLRALRKRGEWRRVFSGEVSIANVLKVIVRRAWIRLRHQVTNLVSPVPGTETAHARDIMRQLALREVRTTFIFSDDDPGLAEMYMRFGSRGRALEDFAPARLVLLDEADHHFNATVARDQHIAILHEMLAGLTMELGGMRAPAARLAPRRARLAVG